MALKSGPIYTVAVAATSDCHAQQVRTGTGEVESLDLFRQGPYDAERVNKSHTPVFLALAPSTPAQHAPQESS